MKDIEVKDGEGRRVGRMEEEERGNARSGSKREENDKERSRNGERRVGAAGLQDKGKLEDREMKRKVRGRKMAWSGLRNKENRLNGGRSEKNK